MRQALVLETSTNKGVIALIDQHRLLQKFFIAGGVNLSNQIFTILQKIGFDPKQLSFIAIGIGPGSYTGIRVSVTIGKTLSYALNIPLVTFCSLQAFIPPIKKGFYLSMLDAKIGGIYSLRGQKCEKKISFETPELLSVDQAVEAIQKTPIICSNEILTLQKKVPKIEAKWIERGPDIQTLSAICLEKWENKDFTEQDRLQPLYLRGA